MKPHPVLLHYPKLWSRKWKGQNWREWIWQPYTTTHTSHTSPNMFWTSKKSKKRIANKNCNSAFTTSNNSDSTFFLEKRTAFSSFPILAAPQLIDGMAGRTNHTRIEPIQLYQLGRLQKLCRYGTLYPRNFQTDASPGSCSAPKAFTRAWCAAFTVGKILPPSPN